MTRRRWVTAGLGLWVAFMVSVGVIIPAVQSLLLPGGPQEGQPVPTAGPPEIGVPYEVAFVCDDIAQVGDTWWVVETNDQWPPPTLRDPWPPFWWPGAIFSSVALPAVHEGILTVTSESSAFWVADGDGSRWDMVPTAASTSQSGCL